MIMSFSVGKRPRHPILSARHGSSDAGRSLLVADGEAWQDGRRLVALVGQAAGAVAAHVGQLLDCVGVDETLREEASFALRVSAGPAPVFRIRPYVENTLAWQFPAAGSLAYTYS